MALGNSITQLMIRDTASSNNALEFKITAHSSITVLLITSVKAIVISVALPSLVDAFPTGVAHELTFPTRLQVVGSAGAIVFIGSILAVHITIAQPPGRDTVQVSTLPLRTSALCGLASNFIGSVFAIVV